MCVCIIKGHLQITVVLISCQFVLSITGCESAVLKSGSHYKFFQGKIDISYLREEISTGIETIIPNVLQNTGLEIEYFNNI